MVSQITTGHPTDRRGRPYRRRRYAPAIVLVVVLLVIAGVVWIIAAASGGSSAVPVACPAPPSPSASPTAATPGQAPAANAVPVKHTVVAESSMLGEQPAALSTFQVRVLNASGQRGAAQNALDDLTSLGFRQASTDPYADDTLYSDPMDCVAQIRFGDATKAAAAAVWVAVPCAELVNDGRSGSVVDLALGEHYTSTEQSQDAQAALDALRTADPNNAKTAVDPSLVRAVHKNAC
ncbi:envelope integrity protein Cei [Gordonia jinhuaensis]|uniref:LytR/CpsA/Psr regulator C-terminal domain-containing protein n=1 Tax=Gordonia jinhuaensis TaxID=1517702 RepID=A0A916T2H9_9ACTN|nr:envelope integrity protein Cei [Gordonia jinhuaensis]GGB25716.1 hypothetical protein GCM10011489_12360 [Gordonia jinhuaensis]